MRNKFFIIFAIFAMVLFSCGRGNQEIDELRERLDLLEQRVEELNKEIDRLGLLVSQMKSGGYVTAVIADEAGDGYTLAFNDGSSVHIKLAASESGTPQIGVRQDADGVWYWTLDGDWLLDASGRKVAASASAPDHPLIKMDDGVWYISYDSGANWSAISTKASGGITFRSVDTSNPDLVVITLSDGTVLRLPTWAAFDALQQQVKQLNINLAALSRIVSALQDNDYLVSTTPFVEDGVPKGWLLNFSKSGLVVIYSSGGYESPQIGVRQDADGVYYWTLDGEWLLSEDGSKVRAEGPKGSDAVPPRLKIEEQYWWISYDDGATWTRLDKAVGESGEGLFADVDVSDEAFVRLVLSDGSTLLVPRYVSLDIVFDMSGGPLLISEGEVIRVPWTVVGTNSADITVSALVNGNLSVAVLPDAGGRGVLEITGAASAPGGSVVVMLSNPSGYSVVRVLNCSPRRLTLYNSAGEACETHLSKLEHYFPVSHEGGTIKIPYNGNTPFVLGPTPEWLRVVKGYDGPSGEIVLEADANTSASVREYHLDINYASTYSVSPVDIFCAIGITQNSSFFEMSPTFIRASAEFTQYKVDIKCSLDDLEMRVAEGSEWLMGNIGWYGSDTWGMIVAVGHNQTAAERTGTVDVLHKGKVLGTLTVVQNAQDADEISKMILKVIATPANGYVVYLPLTGQMDCFVEWGDTYADSISSSEGYNDHLNHKYNCTEPTEYTVKISGSVKGLDSGNLSSYITVVSVDQWGQLGLTSMDHAFCGVTTLESVATDELGGFSGVTTFASAFEGCASLTKVPASLFDHAKGAVSFRRCFYKVDKVTTESPYTVVGDEKVHLYERGQYDVFSPLTDWSNCFFGGNWADQDAIRSHKFWE